MELKTKNVLDGKNYKNTVMLQSLIPKFMRKDISQKPSPDSRRDHKNG